MFSSDRMDERWTLTQLAIVSLSPPIFAFHVCLLTNGAMQLMERTHHLKGCIYSWSEFWSTIDIGYLTWQVLGPYIQVPHICIIYLSLRNTAARRVATRLWPRRSQLWKWRRWRCASMDVGWWKTLKSGMYIPYLRFPSGCINILIWYEVWLVNKPKDACKCINVYKCFWMVLAWWPYLCMFNFNHNSFKTGDGHSWGWFQ